MPTFTPPRRVEIILTDDEGGRRVAVAERDRGYTSQPHWTLALQHPSGRAWPADFNGNNVIDALGELIDRKDHEYHTARGRGAPPAMQPDRNVPVRDDGSLSRADIMAQQGKRVGFGAAAAAASRARSEGGS
jgi:hypothetical protein